jgi:hypothetical protein
MTEYRHTRIKHVVDCLTACWNDIYEMCCDWETSVGYLSEAERVQADQYYAKSAINRNARQLYELTRGVDLQTEVQQGEYSVEMMRTALNEIERIKGRIENYFPRVQHSDEGPVNERLHHDVIHRILYAVDEVKYVFIPYLNAHEKYDSGKVESGDKINIISQDNKQKSQNTKRPSTVKAHEKYVEDFHNYQLIENKDRLEAIKATAIKHQVHQDTIERALGLRK